MNAPSVNQYAIARRILDMMNQILCAYFWKTVIEPSLPKDKNLEMAYVALFNATIESSIISIRILDEVFAIKRARPDDVHQSDFPDFKIVAPFLTKQQKDHINKQIPHLTHTKIVPESSPFPYKDLLGGAIPPSLTFCEYLRTRTDLFVEKDFEYINGTKNILRSVLESYVNCK